MDNIIEKGEYRARIEFDEGFELDMLGDRMGKFYTGKKAANYGFPADVVLYPNEDGITEFEPKDFVYCAAVYGYSHSGMSISLSGFSDKWDSGMIGFYAVGASEAEAWFGKDYTQEQVEAAAAAEVKEMDLVLRGQVFYVVVEKKEPCGVPSHDEYQLADSCGGFVGFDHAYSEAESMLAAAAS